MPYVKLLASGGNGCFWPKNREFAVANRTSALAAKQSFLPAGMSGSCWQVAAPVFNRAEVRYRPRLWENSVRAEFQEYSTPPRSAIG